MGEAVFIAFFHRRKIGETHVDRLAVDNLLDAVHDFRRGVHRFIIDLGLGFDKARQHRNIGHSADRACAGDGNGLGFERLNLVFRLILFPIDIIFNISGLYCHIAAAKAAA